MDLALNFKISRRSKILKFHAGQIKILSRELTGLNLAAKKFAKPLQKEILFRCGTVKF